MSNFIRVEGETCPSGYCHVSYTEAEQNIQELCSILGEWDIARLANSGSMDGFGYNCKIRQNDKRELGHSLCVRNLESI